MEPNGVKVQKKNANQGSGITLLNVFIPWWLIILVIVILIVWYLYSQGQIGSIGNQTVSLGQTVASGTLEQLVSPVDNSVTRAIQAGGRYF